MTERIESIAISVATLPDHPLTVQQTRLVRTIAHDLDRRVAGGT